MARPRAYLGLGAQSIDWEFLDGMMMPFVVSRGHSALSFSPMQLPPRYHEMIWPLIEKAKGFVEKGESLSPLAFVGNFDTGQVVPILIDTLDDRRKDASAIAIRLAAESMAADYVFTVIEGWGLPKDKMLKYAEIIERGRFVPKT